MPQILSQSDQNFIWSVVLRAADKRGGHSALFSTPLEFEDDGQRVRFHWPDWMQEIRTFVTVKYGEKDAQALLLEVFTEVMSRQNYETRRIWLESSTAAQALDTVNR